MGRKKLEESQIKIPEHLINEVDKMVIESGLYSDNIDFIMDACRRLIIENKKENVDLIHRRTELESEGMLKIAGVDPKGSQKKPVQRGDI